MAARTRFRWEALDRGMIVGISLHLVPLRVPCIPLDHRDMGLKWFSEVAEIDLPVPHSLSRDERVDDNPPSGRSPSGLALPGGALHQT